MHENESLRASYDKMPRVTDFNYIYTRMTAMQKQVNITLLLLFI